MSRGGGLRFVGGRFRGRRLRVPGGARPSGGRLREALFSIWRDQIPGARWLDLFAGSGVMGLEALGRGAREVVFVEHSAGAIRILKQNLNSVKDADGYEVGTGRILRARLPAKLPELTGFDLAFADPPYDWEGLEGIPALVRPWLATGGELAIEHSSRRPAPQGVDGFHHRDERAFGESHLSFYRVE